MNVVPKTRFTSHAYFRVVGGDGEAARLRLSPDEVLAILDNDKAVPIGRDPNEQHKIYRAFWSIPDNKCIIAVQDSRNGDVITLLPFSHHSRFVIDPVLVRNMAMGLLGIVPPSTLVVELPDVIAGADTDLIVAMRIRLQSDRPGEIQTKRLLRIAVPTGSLLHEIVQDRSIRKEIEIEAMNQLSWCEGTEVVGFRVHFISNGVGSGFRWFEKDWTPRIPK